MSKRITLQKRLDRKVGELLKIMDEIGDISTELAKRPAKGSRYKETEKSIVSGRGKSRVTTTERHGRRYWKEKFEDGSTGKFIEIERSEIATIDGKGVDMFGRRFFIRAVTNIPFIKTDAK